MNLKLEHLRVFVAVAESGSITAASTMIGRTASAVSMTISQVENLIGGDLFEGERKSRLTPLGSFTLKHAKLAVESHQLAVRDILQFARGEVGLSRIAAVPSVATRLLPGAIYELRRQLPGLRTDIRDIDSLAIHDVIHQGLVDFGIASLPEDDSLDAEFLLEDSYRLICRPDHPMNSLNRPIRLSDIDASEFIVHGLCKHFSDPGMKALVDESGQYVHNTQTILAFVERGLGVSVLPELFHTSDRSYAALPIGDLPLKRSLYILKRRSVSLSPTDLRVIAAIKKAVKGLGLN